MSRPDNQKHDHPPFDALWIHVHLATMGGVSGYGIIKDAAVGISAGRIAWIGPLNALAYAPEHMARKVHDGKGHWLTPGLIDCHTHLVYGGNRAEEFALRMQGKSYAEIAKAGGGILSTVRATRAAGEEELLDSAARRLQSLMAEGITTVEIKSGYGLEMESEMKMLRIAQCLGKLYPVTVRATFLGAHTVPPEYAGRADDYIRHVCEEMLPAVAQETLADAVDGFCEPIAFSPAQMERVFETAHTLGLRVKLHAEQLTDQKGAALAAKYGALSADHLEHAGEDGIIAMKTAGTIAVLLPGAFYMLKETRKPPVALLRKHGVPMALATDCNPGTSPVCSLLLMLNMGCILFDLTPEETLRGVTINAARALGLEDETGTLETGKAADMALWDIAHPVELSYHLGYNPCAGVVKNGIYRMRDRT